MKLPPKTLLQRNTNHHHHHDDNISELTMNNMHPDDSLSDDTSSSISSSSNNNNNSNEKVVVGKNKTKNKLTKYLKRAATTMQQSATTTAGNNSSSSPITTNNHHPRGVPTTTTTTTTTATTRAKPSTSIKLNKKCTIADQMVASMFATNNNNNNNTSSSTTNTTQSLLLSKQQRIQMGGMERAQSWKMEAAATTTATTTTTTEAAATTVDSVAAIVGKQLDSGASATAATNHETMLALSSSSSQHSLSSSSSNTNANTNTYNTTTKDIMEYSTMNITQQNALGYKSMAVGAAAMAVEFGGTFATTTDGSRQRRSSGGDVIINYNGGDDDDGGDGDSKKGRMLMENNYRRRTTGGGDFVPPSKSTNNLSDLELLGQTVQCVNAALQSATIPSSSSSSPTTNNNNNNNKDTTTTAAAVTTAKEEEGDEIKNRYHISSLKFNPRGCVWYIVLNIATTTTTKTTTNGTKKNHPNTFLQVPIKVTLCHASAAAAANDNPPPLSNKNNNKNGMGYNKNKSTTTINKTTYSVKISYHYEPTTTTTTTTTSNTTTSTFHTNFPTLEFSSNNNNNNIDEELITLWIKSNSEIINSMEWLRRKLKRWISRSSSLGMMMMTTGGGGGGMGHHHHHHDDNLNIVLPPEVSVIFPQDLDMIARRRRGGGGGGGRKSWKKDDDDDDDEEKEEVVVVVGGDMVDWHLMNRQKIDTNNQGGGGGGGDVNHDEDDRSRSSPLDKNKKKKNSDDSKRGSDKSIDHPSSTTTKTATTCSMSSYSPVEELDDHDDASSSSSSSSSRTEEEEEEEERIIEEARMELMGKKNGVGSSIGGSNSNDDSSYVQEEEEENKTTTKRGSTVVVQQQTIDQFRGGLVSQHTMRRLLANDNTEDDDEESEEEEDEAEVMKQVVKAMESMHCPPGEIRQAKEGLLSRNTMLKMRNIRPDHDDDDDENENIHTAVGKVASAATLVVVGQDSGSGSSSESVAKKSHVSASKQHTIDLYRDGLVSQNTMRRILSSDNEYEDNMKQVVKAMESEHRPDGEIRVAKAGLVSRNTMLKLRNYREANEESSTGATRPRRSMSQTERDQLDDNKSTSSWEEDEDSPEADDEERMNRAFTTEAETRQARKGLVSQHTMKRLSLDSDNPLPVRENEVKSTRRYSQGEMRMLLRGCASTRSILAMNGTGALGGMKRIPSQIHVSFSDDGDDDSADAEEEKNLQAAESNKVIVAAAKNKKIISEDDDDEENTGMLVFSNNALRQPEKLDVLTEGQYFLGISMLVYMYSHLRETCRMGHTRCSMHDVDTHSVQSQYKKGEASRYLETTKTAGSIIRLVIDELEDCNEDDAEHEIVGGESKEYERLQTAQFRKWIDDSRISQMDEETEHMLLEMKRKVARHRWKRAISAVRLSYRISGGKPPKWENPVVAPGCENQNRFVDMNEMMNETMRNQPKYFKEGSVMNNLIESGIEVVWFSDLSQNDVVYGICVQREEKKITVAFRGTVNAHNWSMNFKFDTNEYRNPVKVNYPGREDELSLHSGFALYLLRKRKDTGMSKMDEIFEKIEKIGKELAPDGDYRLCITGHSLGGALATLFGFYCGAKPRFAHLSTIYIWTFAAPRVGTQAFIHAYQYLERNGRIRHARFSCTNDIVPLIPFCNFEYDDLQFYKHVGMRIQLHDTGRIGKWRLRNNLDVTYPLKHDWPSEIRRVLTNNIFANLNTPKGFKDYHGLTEHQRRLHFAMTYRKALGSSTLNSDKRRNRIKTLDEYYLIRAHIATDGIAEEVLDIQKVDKGKNKGGPSSKWLVRFLVVLLLFTWVLLILSITTDVPLHCVLVPFTMALHGIEHLIHLPVAVPTAVYRSATFRTHQMIHSMLGGTRHFGKSTFVARKAPCNIDVMKKLATERVKNNASRHVKEIIDAKSAFWQENSSKFQVFDRASAKLYNLASIVDNLASPRLTIGSPVEGAPSDGVQYEDGNEVGDDSKERTKELEVVESRLKPIQEYATSITFAPKLDNGLYLVGAGVRKKSVVKVYAVAMYSAPNVLANAASFTTLHDAARTFGSSSRMTSFVLEMVYSAGAEKIAGAIGEGVKPRYDGDPSDIGKLESLIVEGVNAIGGQAIKGTTFRFDCSDNGVSVTVNGVEQGVAAFKGLGSAFVDVFMDGNSVSPTLIESCLKTWSSDENKSVVGSAAGDSTQSNLKRGVAQDRADKAAMRQKVESQLKPIQEYATSVVFNPKLDEGLYLIGAGVRKKSVVKVYAVALYGSASLLSAVSPATLRAAARTFDASTPLTSFVLEMTYSASAEKIGGAIADSVKPRYNGPASDVDVLESLIAEGVNKKGGQASKGTIFRFDCSDEGVTVSVDGSVQGLAKFEGIGSAFVDVFLDDNAVSPTLVSSCMDTLSNPEAKATAVALLELGGTAGGKSSNEQTDKNSSSSLQKAIESNMKPIQEYATSVTFVPKLSDGLYLVGAGVRKKSIVKVYAVAMYSSPYVLQVLSRNSTSGMRNAARSFSPSSPSTTFILEMTYSAGAEKIAGAIAESVKPRYNGHPSNISELEGLIVKGINMKGGQASKGTIFRFDCSQEGVRVSVDGSDQGIAAFEGIGSAFVDVFLDDNAVSPSLIDSCVETWSKVSLG